MTDLKQLLDALIGTPEVWWLAIGIGFAWFVSKIIADHAQAQWYRAEHRPSDGDET